jgi:hypothetical protein
MLSAILFVEKKTGKYHGKGVKTKPIVTVKKVHIQQKTHIRPDQFLSYVRSKEGKNAHYCHNIKAL